MTHSSCQEHVLSAGTGNPIIIPTAFLSSIHAVLSISDARSHQFCCARRNYFSLISIHSKEMNGGSTPIKSPKRRPKSPPMAFQSTSNDALSPPSDLNQMSFHSGHSASPNTHPKVYNHHTSQIEQELQAQIEQQIVALRKQHEAFIAERQCWSLERDRLYRRVGALESLLRNVNDHRFGHQRSFRNHRYVDRFTSPARSPVCSPNSGSTTFTSQHRRSSTGNSSRLPSIAEDDGRSPRSERRPSVIKRDAAPQSIAIPRITFADGPVEGTLAYATVQRVC